MRGTIGVITNSIWRKQWEKPLEMVLEIKVKEICKSKQKRREMKGAALPESIFYLHESFWPHLSLFVWLIFLIVKYFFKR